MLILKYFYILVRGIILSKTSSLYSQVTEKIREKIITGEYPINSKLPNEFELSKKFNVSRVTLRRAIEGLADDGLVKKVRGVGTFVHRPEKVKRIVSTSSIESFSKTAKKEGFKNSVQVIKTAEVRTPIRYESMLKSKNCIFIERLHLIDNEPIMLEFNYFPVPRFLDLKEMDLTKSLYTILHEKYRILKLSSRDTIVSAASASVDEAKFLKKSVGYPLLLFKICIEDEKGKVVHTGRQYVVSDRYEFHI